MLRPLKGSVSSDAHYLLSIFAAVGGRLPDLFIDRLVEPQFRWADTGESFQIDNTGLDQRTLAVLSRNKFEILIRELSPFINVDEDRSDLKAYCVQSEYLEPHMAQIDEGQWQEWYLTMLKIIVYIYPVEPLWDKK